MAGKKYFLLTTLVCCNGGERWDTWFTDAPLFTYDKICRMVDNYGGACILVNISQCLAFLKGSASEYGDWFEKTVSEMHG